MGYYVMSTSPATPKAKQDDRVSVSSTPRPQLAKITGALVEGGACRVRCAAYGIGNGAIVIVIVTQTNHWRV
jgi:hypothetical protein